MGNSKNIVSLILFCIFILSYASKLVVLHKRDKIKANVLAKGKKVSQVKYTEIFVKSTTFLWGAAWLALSIAETFITQFAGKLMDNPWVSNIGIVLTITGLFIFIQAMVSMRTSWRVGIDPSTKTKLVTHGIYKYSRNPAFVGFDFMFLGLFATYPSLLTLPILVLNILSIHLLILQEEKHLKSMFGDEYAQYSKNTPRYILFL